MDALGPNGSTGSLCDELPRASAHLGAPRERDVIKFITYFLPKGAPRNQTTMQAAVRHLHLAFKGMETDEIYDVLMAQLIRAIAKYDPAYTEKVKLVVEAINAKLSQCEQLCLADVGRHVDFDCGRYIRLLCRRGYLTSALGENRRVSGYVRSISWPPKPEFFEQGAIGVAYYLQTWFRYYLQTWIEASMSEVETHEGVYSWDYSHADAPLRGRLRGSNTDGGFVRNPDAEAVLIGNQVDHIGGQSISVWSTNPWI